MQGDPTGRRQARMHAILPMNSSHEGGNPALLPAWEGADQQLAGRGALAAAMARLWRCDLVGFPGWADLLPSGWASPSGLQQ